jgi:acyl-CoA synthetase (NDP forming)
VGYPVVLKVVSPEVIHKSDVGGVVTGIADAAGLEHAYKEILDSVQEHLPEAQVRGMLVCRQAPEGLEVIVGALRDLMFGPSLMFGLGGIFAEALKDVTFRIIPLQRVDAEEMITEIRGYPLLAGARGQEGYDVEALVELLLAVSRLVSERPEIEELDLNPIRLYKQGLEALDVRMMLANPEERREPEQ